MSLETKTKRIEAIVYLTISSLTLLALLRFLVPLPDSLNRPITRIQCINNLKQIGLDFRLWSDDHHHQFPFNLSTNQGGTMEYCDRDTNGFDRNGFRHLMVMSDELSSTRVVLCPSEKFEQLAVDFAHIADTNVTYQIPSGTHLSWGNSNDIIAVCPIHGNIIFTDGSVRYGGHR